MPSVKNIDSVKELTVKLNKAKAVYFTDYLGLDVVSVTKLRKSFVEKDIEFTVAKNTLIKLATKELGISGVDEFLKGPTALAFSYEEPTDPAKIIKEFLKDHELPTIKGVLFEGSYLDSSQFDKIANLPSKDESLTKLAIMLKSPVQNFSNLLSSPMLSLLNVLKGIEKSKSLQN